MVFRKIALPALCILLFSLQNVVAQTTFYDLNTIQKIEIFFSGSDWDYQLDTAKYGSDDYVVAEYLVINGVFFDSVGVKYKGNSSYDSTYSKNPFHIELDTYLNQSYQGIKDIKLSNFYADPSMIREVLAYDILGNYMDCPRSNFAEVYVNGNYIGLYSNSESIGKQFLSDHFLSSNNTFIKCNPVVNPGPTAKCNLKYISADSSQYFNFYEVKSTYGWNDLVNLCDTVTNNPAGIPSVFDVDRALWMLAFNNVLINLDSYSGAFCQNYYLYRDATTRYNPIVWDLNMAFGGFPFVGSGVSSLGTLTVANMQQLTPLVHSTDNYWPLIKNILSDNTFKKMYFAHLRTITNEFFANTIYQAKAAQMQALIDTAVQNDINKFYSYSQFQNGLNGDVISGSFTIPGISNLMGPRVSYLQSTAEFTNTPPSITSVATSSSSPAVGSTVTISALVTNTNSSSVYLGYRLSASEKFNRILMYDDGAHNDGAAGDNVYGASFQMLGVQAQYYIYAENNNVGIFSPERAEHEYYNLTAGISVTTPGQVVINEFVAQNTNGIQDEAGQREDWIELYNNTSVPVDLYGLYLSDNYNNLSKFAFPQNTIIPANGFLLIWADEDPSTSSYIHANFKLSAAGEQIILSNVAGTIIDSLTFGAQASDVSTGRCPDGNGVFGVLATQTPEASNCITSVDDFSSEHTFMVYPNPASFHLIVDFREVNGAKNIMISDQLGHMLIQSSTVDKTEYIDLAGLSSGLYFITLNNQAVKKFQVVR